MTVSLSLRLSANKDKVFLRVIVLADNQVTVILSSPIKMGPSLPVRHVSLVEAPSLEMKESPWDINLFA
jgi:hypothetical protein